MVYVCVRSNWVNWFSKGKYIYRHNGRTKCDMMCQPHPHIQAELLIINWNMKQKLRAKIKGRANVVHAALFCHSLAVIRRFSDEPTLPNFHTTDYNGYFPINAKPPSPPQLKHRNSRTNNHKIKHKQQGELTWLGHFSTHDFSMCSVPRSDSIEAPVSLPPPMPIQLIVTIITNRMSATRNDLQYRRDR